MAWTEIDSAATSPAETDIPFGPIGTKTTILGQMVVRLDNLPSQHQHYSLLPNYFNEAKDELLTLGLGMGRSVLDQLPRLQHWRWYDVTVSGQNYLPLPERMLDLEAMGYTESTAAYDSSTTTLKPSTLASGASEEFGLFSRTATGYPTLFRRAGARIEYWPTTSTTPVDSRTTVVVQGTRMDVNLSADADTLLMSPRLQLLAIDLAVVVAMEKMRWDEAEDGRVALESKLARLISPGGRERMRSKVRTRVAGTP